MLKALYIIHDNLNHPQVFNSRNICKVITRAFFVPPVQNENHDNYDITMIFIL